MSCHLRGRRVGPGGDGGGGDGVDAERDVRVPLRAASSWTTSRLHAKTNKQPLISLQSKLSDLVHGEMNQLFFMHIATSVPTCRCGVVPPYVTSVPLSDAANHPIIERETETRDREHSEREAEHLRI